MDAIMKGLNEKDYRFVYLMISKMNEIRNSISSTEDELKQEEMIPNHQSYDDNRILRAIKEMKQEVNTLLFDLKDI